MKLRDHTHEPHDVLGVSPTSEPELIDAAYHSLIRKYGGRYGDLDRVRTIEAAYDQLKAPQRGHGHSAPSAGQEATVDGPPMWQVRPRSKLSEATPAPPARSAAPPALAASPPPVLACEPSFSRAPVPGHVNTDGPAARHWTISDWSSDKSPASASEQAEPTDQPSEYPVAVEDTVAVAAISRPQFGMPLAAGLAVITAALVTQYLIDPSTRLDKSEVRAATATFVPRPIVPPQERAARQRQVRSAEVHSRFIESKQQPASAPVAVEVAASAKDRRQVKAATATAIAQTEVTSETSLARAEPAAPAPVSATPLNPVTAIPTLPTVASKQASQEPPAAPPTQSQATKPKAAMALPARWISGGLQDSDNKYGRFVGAVAVRVLVRPNGRAGGCRIAQSSGNPTLDQTTCRLLGERLLFSPAQDAAGRPIDSEVGTTYVWGRRVRR